MKNEEKQAFLAQMMGMMKGANINMDHAQINMIVESGAKVVYQEVASSETPSEKNLTHEELAKAVAAVQAYMWGASAYAVLFCECRDHRGYPNNMAQFERDIDVIARERHLTYGCKAGTLSDAFRHNSYLEKHVDKWKDMGVKTRSMHLLQVFQEALP